jgi:hypothetical protein
MKNEDIKTMFFRFIDVLPSLKTDDLVVRLLNEYFAGETDVPKIISGGIERIPRKGIVPRVAARVIRTISSLSTSGTSESQAWFIALLVFPLHFGSLYSDCFSDPKKRRRESFLATVLAEGHGPR